MTTAKELIEIARDTTSTARAIYCAIDLAEQHEERIAKLEALLDGDAPAHKAVADIDDIDRLAGSFVSRHAHWGIADPGANEIGKLAREAALIGAREHHAKLESELAERDKRPVPHDYVIINYLQSRRP